MHRRGPPHFGLLCDDLFLLWICWFVGLDLLVCWICWFVALDLLVCWFLFHYLVFAFVALAVAVVVVVVAAVVLWSSCWETIGRRCFVAFDRFDH